MANFIRIQSIHHLLTDEATSSLLLSSCMSHLDYCNSVLYGLPDVTINRMQKVQNMCAHLVLRKSKWDSALNLLIKTTLATNRGNAYLSRYVCLHISYSHQQGPQYLQEMLQYKTQKRDLRSSSDNSLLLIPRTKCKTFTARAFSVSALTLWNTLHRSLRELPTLLRFKCDLKTHLYQEAFE